MQDAVPGELKEERSFRLQNCFNRHVTRLVTRDIRVSLRASSGAHYLIFTAALDSGDHGCVDRLRRKMGVSLNSLDTLDVCLSLPSPVQPT